MNNPLIVRQAIYDKQLKVYAYQLLSSDETEHNAPNTIINALSEVELSQLVGDKMTFINSTYDFIIDNSLNSDLPNQLAINIPKDIGSIESLITAVTNISGRNHKITLNDPEWNDKNQPLIEVADIIKFNISQQDVHSFSKKIKNLKGLNLLLLAENIATQEEYEQCRAIGFDLFQGHFFCQPKILDSNRRAPANRMAIVNLLAKLQNPDVHIEELEMLISQDLALSFRLLKYINSAAFALQREIDSIHHAIIMLGLNTVRNVANLMLMSNIDDKPSELFILAIIRARMCQELGIKFDVHMKDTFFTSGLFSVIDALMDSSMEDVVSQLPLSSTLKKALLEGKGIAGEVLTCCIAFEDADWKNVKIRGIEHTDIQKAYFDALIWSNNAMAFVIGK